jgi:molybdenum cofactor cytidylyltransferase
VNRIDSSLRGGAVILAAGASSRMGAPKALLTHADGRSFLRTCCEALSAGDLEPIVVVIGHHRELLESELERIKQTAVCRPEAAINEAPERGQISSLALGLAALAGRGIPFAIVALVDQPVIPREVLTLLIAAASREPDAVHVPVCDGVRGHPAAFPTLLGAALRLAAPNTSTRDWLSQRGFPVREHAAAAPAIRVDLDTPEELAAWRADTERR